ncbi:alpha/beta hydrolase [Brucella pseudogrignonensis]|uniref:alpha/beta hydrolase n=1 Tax=Brucella pseudogrignonensis TaxID=419475 RepID=UPI000DE44D80|nr:alpha/beta hydrolase [Brucella pseudogrignonensis]KAB2692224.1 alpha/beta hydrolase [Brucella pseudogrignonensis]
MSFHKRLVIQFTGYEGLHPKAVRVRHAQALKDFDRLWHAKTKLPPMKDESDDCGSLTATTNGNGWQTETEFCQFGTADIFDDYAARSTPMRMLTGFRAFMNIFFTGTLLRYLLTSWRFVMFFMWPFLLSIVIIAIAALIASAPMLAGFPSWNLAWSLPLAAVIATLLVRWPGDRFFMSYLLDDWSAAYDRIYSRNDKLKARRRAFAEALKKKIEESNADEVIIVAHSLGTVPAVEALADVQRERPDLLTKQPVSMLAIGSCLLMIALHPKARGLREDVRVVMNESPVLWSEFQVLTDIIHFYGSDPAKALKIKAENPPLIHRIRFKNVHSENRYKRSKGNFFLMHLLYMRGAEKKNFYDFGMFLHGPFFFRELMTTHKDKAAPLDEEGRLQNS